MGDRKEKAEANERREEERKEVERIENLRWKRADLIKPYYNFFEEKQGLNLGELTAKEFNDILEDLKSKKADHDKDEVDSKLKFNALGGSIDDPKALSIGGIVIDESRGSVSPQFIKPSSDRLREVNTAIFQAIEKLSPGNGKMIAAAIIRKEIPNLTINYEED